MWPWVSWLWERNFLINCAYLKASESVGDVDDNSFHDADGADTSSTFVWVFVAICHCPTTESRAFTWKFCRFLDWSHTHRPIKRNFCAGPWRLLVWKFEYRHLHHKSFGPSRSWRRRKKKSSSALKETGKLLPLTTSNLSRRRHCIQLRHAPVVSQCN